MCELSRFFTWALMVKVDSQICVRVNSQGVRVTSQPVQVISKHCTSCRLCGVPPHPYLNLTCYRMYYSKNNAQQQKAH